jgi:uncharacterized protein (DUF58 family)
MRMKSAPAYRFLPPELADRLRSLSLTVRRPVEGGKQGAHRSPHHGASVEFSDYREYTQGDPPNLIDWAVLARSDRYVIRRYIEETNLRAFVLLDTSESMAFQEQGLHSKMDYACFLAAGLIYILIHQGDSAGLVLFNDKIQAQLPPVGSLEGLRPLLLALESIKPAGRSGIEEALHAVAEQIRLRSLILLISDCLRDPADILRGIRHLHHNGHEVTVLHLMDPAELRLGFHGLVELKELETGEKLLLEADEYREAYAAEAQRHLEALRRGCIDCLADYHFVDTRRPVEEALHLRTSRE